MQQPYPPRLHIGAMPGESSGTSIGSPGGPVFASPASYSPLPAMLTPEFRQPTGFYTARADAPDHIPASAPQLGRQVSVSSSTGSPLTPVHPANMSSPFFPQTDFRLPQQPALSSFARPHASSFHSAASQQPSRRATLHAATPSFHPAATSRSFDPAPFPWSLPQNASRVAGLRRSESVSLRPGDDPLRSPTLSRASSASPALPIKREEPKRRKIVVRLPRELDSGAEPDLRFGEGDAMPEEDGTKDGEDKDKRLRSTIRRVPLKDVEHPQEDAAKNLRPEKLVGREQHEDEVKKSELPSAIDVYLPGKAAWEEVWDAFEQQVKGSYGYCTAVDSVRGVASGHSPSISLSRPTAFGGIGSPVSSSLSPVLLSRSPVRLSPTIVPPLFASRAPTSPLARAAATPLPTSPEAPVWIAADGVPSWLPSAAELSRGFSITEEPEDEAASAERGHSDAYDGLASIPAGSDIGVPKERRRAPPSRSASGVSTKTDATGVASLSGQSDRSWTDTSSGQKAHDQESAEPLHSDAPSPELHHELSRALTALGTLEVAGALPPLPLLPVINVDVEPTGEGDLTHSDDSQYGDAELSADEYSNPSEEDAARARAVVRSRSARHLRAQVDEGATVSDDDDDKPLASLTLRAPVDILFEAPSDIHRFTAVDASPSKVKAEHKVTQNFEFPPRSPHSSPVKKRQAADVALPSSPESYSSDSGRIAQLLHGHSPSSLPYLASTAFRRRPSETSSGSHAEVLAFNAFGHPGSLTISPQASSEPSPAIAPSPLNPGAGEYRPPAALPTTTSGLSATAAEFTPSFGAFTPALPASNKGARGAFDFFPPPHAPALPPQQSRHVSGSHGPLPALPSDGSEKRQKVNPDSPGATEGSTSMQRVISTPVLAHPQPRRPLPVPPAHLTIPPGIHVDDDEVELLRDDLGGASVDKRDPAEESEVGNRSFASADDPLPEQYAPTQPVTRRRAAGARNGSDVAGLSCPQAPDANGSHANGAVVEAGPMVSPARMGDPRARKESVDIALPTPLRAKSKAIPLPMAKKISARDIFDNEAMPFTPSIASTASSVVEISDDEGDLPLRILEEVIANQFDSLKSELALARAPTVPLELVDTLAHRIEALLATGERGTTVDLALTKKLDELQSRLELVVTEGLERATAHNATVRQRRPTVSTLDPTRPVSAPPARPATPGLEYEPAAQYGAFIDDLRAVVQPLAKNQVDVEALSAKLVASLQPQLTALLAHEQSSIAAPGREAMGKLQVSLDELAGKLALEKAQVESPTSPAFPVTFAETIAAAVVSRLENAPALGDDRLAQAEAGLVPPSAQFDLDSFCSTLDALKTGQAQQLAILTTSQSLQAALKDAVGQLTLDLTSRHDSANSDRQELLRKHASTLVPQGPVSDKLADLELQLGKLQVEVSKVRAEKAILNDRLAYERDRFKADVSALQKQLEAAQSHDKLDKLEHERDMSRELVVLAQGEIMTLEKRLAAQDERMTNIQRLKIVQQQTLAAANQRNKQQATALTSALDKVKELEAAAASADEQSEALKVERDKLAQENEQCRQHFSTAKQGLEGVRAQIKREQAEAAQRMAALVAERDALILENERLASALTSARRGNGMADYPSPSTPTNGQHSLSRLVAQQTGSSSASDDTVAHTDFSPTPSVAGLSFAKSDDGWYSSAET
ncbi:hypothetical protein Rhopal_005378-T1 [Rhodotorula paludigena]|uniref:Proteophosphoglycan ppg4 n=1 Tax=Rhodotorula paludigena TaxID=86838 RepID=A0AAV5GUT1_9BASI|nr:hypothetical protein Rhopal_005378-T1 [Rhodotorula paludigena]